MTTLVRIFFLVLTYLAVTQKQSEAQQPCIPPAINGEIVSIDSLPVHHSFCLQLYKIDKHNRVVVSSIVCDTSNGNIYFLFDTLQVGMQYDKYYDSTGKIIFESTSRKSIILECYNTFVFYENSDKLMYKEGYKLGEPIKIGYEYDKYGNYAKRVITTDKEITTITYTDRRDSLGNYIQETKTIPRKQNRE